MPGVTISAGYGAGGSVVAPHVAKLLGFPLLDRAISSRVAAQLRVSVQEAEGGAARRSLPDRFISALVPLAAGVIATSTDTLPRDLAAPPGDGALFREQADITIEDDMAVLVRYASGASMSYHLTAYSPWEGCRVMFNGSAGRLELEVVESSWQRPRAGPWPGGGAIHGDVNMANAGGATIRLRRLWEPPADIPVVAGHQGHGGADERMLTALYGPPASVGQPDSGNVRGQSASQRDGAFALAVGVAANESFRTGRPVQIADLIPGLRAVQQAPE